MRDWFCIDPRPLDAPSDISSHILFCVFAFPLPSIFHSVYAQPLHPTPPRLHSWMSMQQRANINTLMQPFIFQLRLFLRGSRADCRNYGCPYKWKWKRGKKYIYISWGEKTRNGGHIWLERENVGALKAEVLFLYRLEDQSSQHFPSGQSKGKGKRRGRRFYSDAALPAFSIPPLRKLNLLLWSRSQKQAFLL